MTFFYAWVPLHAAPETITAPPRKLVVQTRRLARARAAFGILRLCISIAEQQFSQLELAG